MAGEAAEAAGELHQFATEWRAEEHAEQRKTDAKVAAMSEPAPEGAPEAVPPAVPGELVQLSSGLWTVLDRLITGMAGAEFALRPDEVAQLAQPTAAVVQKYMPDVLQRLTSTPEGVLLGTVALVYGPKAAAMLMAPAPAAPATAAAPQPQPEAAA